MAENGVKSNNFDPVTSVDELLGNKDNSTVRIAISNLIAQITAQIGPPYDTRSALYADLAWPDGAVGSVWGDDVDSNRGVYKKSGAEGAGGWSRIGDLPQSTIELAALSEKADKADLLELERLVSEKSDRSLLDALNEKLGEIGNSEGLNFVLRAVDRPGDNPDAFSGSLLGAGAEKDALTRSAILNVSGLGDTYAAAGAAVVAKREPVAIGTDIWEFSAKILRTQNPSDPSNHAVVFQVQWLDKNKGGISTTTFVEELTLVTGMGVVEWAVRVSSLDVEDVIAPPLGAVYAVPYIQTFGEDGVTVVDTLRAREVTDLHIANVGNLSAIIASANAAAQAANDAAELVATETLNTMGDVSNYVREAGVGVLTLKGGFSAFDGFGGQWAYNPNGFATVAKAPFVLIGADGANYEPVGQPLLNTTPPKIWVDSVNGSDSNAGTSQFLPLKTLGAAKLLAGVTLPFGLTLRLAAGSSWREGLPYENYRNVKVEGFGDFVQDGLPELRGDDVIVQSWTADGAAYWIDWVHDVVTAAQTQFPIFENGAMATKAPSLADCKATPGTYWHQVQSETSGQTVRIYYHPIGSSNPNADGNVYETYRRHEVIAVGDHSEVRWVLARASGATLGSIYHGEDCKIENVMTAGNHLHDINGASSSRYRCVSYHPVSPTGAAIIMETFAPDGKNKRMSHEKCIAIGPPTISEGDTDVSGFGGHNAANGDDWDVCELIDCAGRNVTFDCGDTKRFKIVRPNMINGSVLLPERADGEGVDCEIIDWQLHHTGTATRKYIVANASGGNLLPSKVFIEGARIYADSPDLTALFLNPANIEVVHSVIVAPTTKILSMVSTVQRQSAKVSHSILVSSTTGIFYDVRAYESNGGFLDSDFNILWPLVTNGNDSADYRGPNGSGGQTTKQTLADIQATFGLELNSIAQDPIIKDAANCDWRFSNSGGIPGVGPARLNIDYTPIPQTEQECLDWLIKGAF